MKTLVLWLCLWCSIPNPAFSQSGSPVPAPPKFPVGTLLLHKDGNFYGTSTAGGELNQGTLFRVSPTGELKVLVNFTGKDGAAKGSEPYAELTTDAAGWLWGSTIHGGALNFGTLFKVNPTSGEFITLVEFTGNEGNFPGSKPIGRLANDGRGFFWGVAQLGGKNLDGTLFKISSSGGQISTVIDFKEYGKSAPGKYPLAGVFHDGRGNVWGSTTSGGPGEGGTVYKVNATTGALSIVSAFSGKEGIKGYATQSELVPDGKGNLWGTTYQCSPTILGTVFKLNTSTGALTTVAEFTGDIGQNKGEGPRRRLAHDGLGFLWGVTELGGSGRAGTVFKINIQSGALTTVAEFSKAKSEDYGGIILGGLVNDGKGAMWGVAQHGGKGGCGTVYKIDIRTGVLTTVVHLGAGSKP